MAGEIPDLIATERTGTGKGAARQARRDGLVPGIIYGGGTDPLPINMPFNVLPEAPQAGPVSLDALQHEGRGPRRRPRDLPQRAARHRQGPADPCRLHAV